VIECDDDDEFDFSYEKKYEKKYEKIKEEKDRDEILCSITKNEADEFVQQYIFDYIKKYYHYEINLYEKIIDIFGKERIDLFIKRFEDKKYIKIWVKKQKMNTTNNFNKLQK
jgi:hypothetical protein